MIILNEILFLLFAFITVFLSIRLSYYVDYINKSTGVNVVVLGSVLLGGVTSLPEFVTCFSAIMVDNELLAIGDILGSNIFNIFMICFFDLVFIKKKLFDSYSKSNGTIFLFLVINYVLIYLFLLLSKISFFYNLIIGIPSLVIFISYGLYLFKISRTSEKKVKINDSSCDNAIIKLIVTIVLMIFSSIILTVIVNKLSHMHPYFSSSFLGAIFLGITTSLPEVVTCYTLINIDSFDLAISDIIGSNFFNLLILSFGDLFVRRNIYSYADNGVLVLVVLGLVFTFLTFINNKKTNCYSYGISSFLIVVTYLGYWIINFLG